MPAMVLVLLFFSGITYSQTFQWARPAAGQGYDYGNYITTDDSGNVYVSGQYEYNCNFGTKTISTSGQHDIFIAKYNSAGTLIWVERAGGTDGDAGHGVGLDAMGNIYTTGEFEKTCRWSPTDSATVGGTSVNNIYISKHDNNGNLVWVRSVVSNGDGRGRGLVSDSAGNFYFTGSFARNAQFGNININYYGWADAFLAKYDKDGNALWVRKSGGSSDDKGKGVALDNFGNVFLCATFTNTANISGHFVSASGLYDSYIVKYDTSGNYIWSVKAGGNDTTKMSAITTDNDGNVYVTGYFLNTTTFGTTTLTSLGSYEFFIAKYDANGNFVWAKKGGGANEDFGQGISYDSRRNLIYATGQFDYMANFDGIPVTSVGNRDIFISCWDTSGAIQWIKTAGGPRRDAGFCVASDTMGNVFASGFVDEGGTFGSFNIVGDTMADIFVTKISPPVAVQPTISSSNISSSITNCTDINLNWTPGNGVYRTVIAKAGSAVGALPTDGFSYVANSNFGSGSYLGSGCYVVYTGSGSACSITGLTAGTRYYFAIVEFNGSGSITNYNTTSYATTNVIANSFAVNVSATPAGICPGGSTTLTASGGLSYTWSPSTGLSATTGASVTATLSSSVTYTITAIDGNGCYSLTTLPVTVNPLPTVTLANIPEACISSTSVALTGGSPAGGTYSGSFVTAGNFSPSSAGTGLHPITYSYTDANGCSNAANANINVRPLPVVTVSSQNSLCVNTAPVILTGGSPAGGTYSGTGVSNGSFNPSVAGDGSHIITYNYADAFGCSGSDSTTLLVNPLPSVSIGTFNALCRNASAVVLTNGSPAGGTYSGTGVVNGSFIPNVAGAGTHTITYTYTNSNGCASSAASQITVNALPVVTLGAFNAVCLNSGTITLSGGSPAGGTYTGSGVSNGIFSPSSAGSNTIIYTYVDGNGCSSFGTNTILVNALPSVSITPINAVCQNSGPLLLTGGNPSGGTWTGNNVSSGNFNPVNTGNNMVIYNYTDGNGCANFASTNILVNTLPVVSLGSDTTICMYNNIVLNAGGGFSTYQWSNGSVTQTAIIDSSGTGIGAGTFSVTVTNAANCSATDFIQVTFDICASVTQVNGQPPLGIVYPNPFSNQFTVFTDENEKEISVTLSDVLGNIVLKKILTSPSEIIRPQVAQGVYFLRIEKGKTISTIKLLKTN